MSGIITICPGEINIFVLLQLCNQVLNLCLVASYGLSSSCHHLSTNPIKQIISHSPSILGEKKTRYLLHCHEAWKHRRFRFNPTFNERFNINKSINVRFDINKSFNISYNDGRFMLNTIICHIFSHHYVNELKMTEKKIINKLYSGPIYKKKLNF